MQTLGHFTKQDYEMVSKMDSIFRVVVLTVLIQFCIAPELSLADRVDQQCDRKCKCITNEWDVEVYCDGVDIDRVPRLPVETTKLSLRFNRFEKVTNKTFKHTYIPNLNTLDFSSNSNLTIIEDNAFQNTSFPDLKKLDLQNDNLSDPNQVISVVESLPKLQYIAIKNNNDLDCNKISNYFNRSGRTIIIACDNNEESKPTTVETTEHLPLPRKPDHISTETNPNGSIDEDINTLEDTWSSDTIASPSAGPATTTVASTRPSTSTTPLDSESTFNSALVIVPVVILVLIVISSVYGWKKCTTNRNTTNQSTLPEQGPGENVPLQQGPLPEPAAETLLPPGN